MKKATKKTNNAIHAEVLEIYSVTEQMRFEAKVEEFCRHFALVQKYGDASLVGQEFFTRSGHFIAWKSALFAKFRVERLYEYIFTHNDKSRVLYQCNLFEYTWIKEHDMWFDHLAPTMGSGGKPDIYFIDKNSIEAAIRANKKGAWLEADDIYYTTLASDLAKGYSRYESEYFAKAYKEAKARMAQRGRKD